MPRRDLVFEPGMFCHVVNRGVDREPIFLRPADYEFFLHGIARFFPSQSITVIAYCLMPNHYHLLLRLEDDVLSRVIQRLTMSFSLAMNLRRRRTGPLFTGRFRSVVVRSDEQLVHTSAYIHLNPVAAGLAESPLKWPYSSYRAYLGRRSRVRVDPSPVLELFATEGPPGGPPYDGASASYRRYVEDLAPGALRLREPRTADP